MEVLIQNGKIYNEQCLEVEQLDASGRLLRFAPSRSVDVTRLEKDMEKLGDLYWLGYQDCMDQIHTLRSYLSSRLFS